MPMPAGRTVWTASRLRALLALCVVASYAMSARPALAQEPDPRYWRMDEVRNAFDDFAAAYPAIFHQETLGLSGDGETIPLACISDNAGQSEPEPRLVFHAAQHANECNGTGAIMATIAGLLAGYGNDPNLTARVDGLELYFIPILNPSISRTTVSTSTATGIGTGGTTRRTTRPRRNTRGRTPGPNRRSSPCAISSSPSGPCCWSTTTRR
jgi:hypothetical protein